MNTTRNYLICDAFSATFSENVTNVHCSPKHCDDFFNSSRFYDVFLFFVMDVHWSPKHCDNLLNSSRFYDVFLFFVTNTVTICLVCRDSTTYSYFFVTDVHGWILKPKLSRRFVKFVAILRRIPFFLHKHCDDLFSLSRFYDVFIFFRHRRAWMDIEAQTITTIC
jgi:hypothetical protein